MKVKPYYATGNMAEFCESFSNRICIGLPLLRIIQIGPVHFLLIIKWLMKVFASLRAFVENIWIVMVLSGAHNHKTVTMNRLFSTQEAHDVKVPLFRIQMRRVCPGKLRAIVNFIWPSNPIFNTRLLTYQYFFVSSNDCAFYWTKMAFWNSSLTNASISCEEQL